MASSSLNTLLLTPDELKAELPIPYVMYHYGHDPVDESTGRLHYHNPFRDDTNPSFDVFYTADGLQRWGDFAEGTSGSVIDLVMRFDQSEDFRATLPLVRQIYDAYLNETDWEADLKPTDRLAELPEDVLEADLELPIVKANQSKVLRSLLRGRPGISVKSLQAFEVRDGGSFLAAVYPDQRAIRLRDEREKWFRGGSKVSLYHAPGRGPADLPALPILLVEGESDAWAAYGTFQREMVVCAVPGTGHPPERFISEFMGRRVVLGFDGDDAGRLSSRRWAAALKEASCSVSILPLSEGADIASLAPQVMSDLMNRRRQATVNITNLKAARAGYVLVAPDGSKEDPVSNWTAKVIEVLLGEDDHSYVCRIESSEGQMEGTYTLTPKDLHSGSAMSSWCRQFHGAWWGNTTAAHKLVAELEEQSVYVPMTRTVSRPILVQPSGFSLPGMQINTDVKLEEESILTEIQTMTWQPRQDPSIKTLERLLSMHKPSVMHPILAWMAIAPLRSRYSHFPELFVTGPSGSGKTTILTNVLKLMLNITSYSALTSTTPYAVAMKIGGTNCLPVWFDEYRPGGKRAALEMLDQTIRDAYDGTVSLRGGMAEDKTKLTALNTDAPIVISGEDLADEQSHRDRLIRVAVPAKGKGRLPGRHSVDLAFALEYYWWLATASDSYSKSAIIQPPVVDDEKYLADDFNDRQAWNMAIVDAGWRLLGDFAEHLDSSCTLPELDLSGLYEMAEDDSGDRILEFLVDMYESWGNTNAMFYDKKRKSTYISARMVMAKAKNERVDDLPFENSRALHSHLLLNMDGERISPRPGPTGGAKARYVRIEGNVLQEEQP